MDETQPERSVAKAELKIDATLIGKLNLADFQNAVPLIRDLWLVTGARIRERVLQLARACYCLTDEDVGAFFWPRHLDPTVMPPFRVPADEDSVRPVDEISLPELISLARTVTERGAQGEAAYQAMAHELGLQMLRAASRARLEKALESL